MVEEKIIRINLRKKLLKIPKWRRKSDFVKLLKRRLKMEKIVISPKLNEKIWSDNSKIKLKVTKDDKLVKIDVVE